MYKKTIKKSKNEKCHFFNRKKSKNKKVFKNGKKRPKNRVFNSV